MLYVVSEPWYFANHRLDHARGLIDAGFEVHVATRRGDRFDEVAEAGCVMHELAVHRGSSGARSLLGEIRELRKIVRTHRPNIVHAVALKPVALALPLIAMFRRPALILSVNGLGISAAESSRGLTAFRRTLGLVGRLPRVELLFQTVNDQRAVVADRGTGTLIPGVGVDLERFSPSSDLDDGPPLRVAYLGRAVRSKGLTDLAEAAHDERLTGLGIEIHAYCALDESSPGSLTSDELDTVAQARCLTLHEPTRDPAGVLARSHAAILPSRAGEGVSKFVLESFATGTPILLSRESGSAEVVEHGVNGVTFTAGDPDAIADALVEFAEWPQSKRHEVALACRQLAEDRYGLNVIVPAIISLHERLLG